MKDPNDISRSYKMLSQCNQILVRAEYADTPNGKEKAKKVFMRFKEGKEIRGEELQRRCKGASNC